MPSQISVIVPALNERESIARVVESMPWDLIAECIVVDNGSTDGTADIAEQSGARVIHAPRGFGSAMHAGALAALPESEILAFCDGDFAYVIDDLPRLTGAIAR